MVHTCSEHQLDRIYVISNGMDVYVWLRRNVSQVTDENGTHWEADEVHGTLPATTSVAYVEAHFDELWDEWDDTPIVRRIADVRDVESVQGDAIDDLAWLASDTGIKMSLVMDAIADLGTDVSVLYEQFAAGGE